MSDRIYYLDLSGQTAGPFLLEEVRTFYLLGKVDESTIYTTPQSVEWLPLSTIIPLFAALPTPAAEQTTAAPSAVPVPNQPGIVEKQESNVGRGGYIVLGLLFGGIGLHNFYASRYVVGFVQLLFPLLTLGYGFLLTIPWAILDLLFVRTDGRGRPMR